MDFSRQRLLAMAVLVALPVCLASVTAMGLWNLAESLSVVAEEYDELREIEAVDEQISNARLAMESDDPKLRAGAKGMLAASEQALVHYLAEQSGEPNEAEHQALEAREASGTIESVRRLLDGGLNDPELASRQIEAVRSGLDRLKRIADGSVRTAQDDARRTRRLTLTWVIGSSLAYAAVCVGLLSWTNLRVNRHLQDLHQRLAFRASGTKAAPANEIGGVVMQIEEINSRMLDKIEESGREIARRERLAAIGVLAADVAHEINNPMNAMLGLTELAIRSVDRGQLDQDDRAELSESLHIVRREALRCKVIVDRFVAMARSDRSPAWFDANALARETVQVAQAARPDRANCFVHLGGDVSVSAFAPASDVRQILLTLLINAADAIEADGRIEVDAARHGQEVWVRVRDNGRGFSDEVKRSLFTPFRSFGQGRGGLGLGLSIAQSLAESMGAQVRASSQGPGTGSTFLLAISAGDGVE